MCSFFLNIFRCEQRGVQQSILGVGCDVVMSMPGFSEQCGVAKRIARVVAQSYGSVVSSGVWMCVPARLVRAEYCIDSIILCVFSFVCYVSGFRFLYCLA